MYMCNAYAENGPAAPLQVAVSVVYVLSLLFSPSGICSHFFSFYH